EATEVHFLYGADALYIGARMHSAAPSRIQAALARRDNLGQAEALLVSLDPYLDHHSAYTFGITAAGTRLDWYHPTDSEDDTDPSFDPVWEGAARIDSAGWVAELRIPFSQLRFNAAPIQSWGLNLRRSVPARNEESYWVLVPRSESGW